MLSNTSVSFPRSLSAAGLMALLALSSCTSSGSGGALGSATKSSKPSADETVDLRAFCPKIKIRAGTETMRVYPKGVKKDDADAKKQLQFQATIQESVRECNYIANTLSMRVGIAGRVINGPTGGAGALELPIRIAVTRGDDVLYSRLHKISSNMEPGGNLATFRFVDEAVNIDKPDKPNVQIFVGFDEGPYDTP